MQGSSGVNQSLITQNYLRLTNVANVAIIAIEQKINELARNIIAYFVKALIMPIGALVMTTKIQN